MDLEKNIAEYPIVFYDGDCGFCNGAVQFLLKKRKKPIYFVALQSEKAKELLRPYQITIDLTTIYLLQSERLHDRSTAALILCRSLKGGYPILYFLAIWLPKSWRDSLYNHIAKRRSGLRKAQCYLPSEEEKKYFLSER